MSVISTVGTLRDRMWAGIRFSEENRAAAKNRAGRVEEAMAAIVRNRAASRGTTVSELEVATSAAQRADSDSLVKVHVANEQWGARLATMYAVAQLTSDTRMINVQLTDIREQQQRIINVLERIATILENRAS